MMKGTKEERGEKREMKVHGRLKVIECVNQEKRTYSLTLKETATLHRRK